MTRLLLIPYDQTFLILETKHSPKKLATAINSDHWKPPKGIREWLSQYRSSLLPFRLCASIHGSLVIDTTRKLRAISTAPAGISSAFTITQRQHQVLQGLMAGQTTKEIAARLAIQPRTVFMHIATLKQTFGTRSRMEMISRAARMGIMRVLKKKLR